MPAKLGNYFVFSKFPVNILEKSEKSSFHWQCFVVIQGCLASRCGC